MLRLITPELILLIASSVFILFHSIATLHYTSCTLIHDHWHTILYLQYGSLYSILFFIQCFALFYCWCAYSSAHLWFIHYIQRFIHIHSYVWSYIRPIISFHSFILSYRSSETLLFPVLISRRILRRILRTLLYWVSRKYILRAFQYWDSIARIPRSTVSLNLTLYSSQSMMEFQTS